MEKIDWKARGERILAEREAALRELGLTWEDTFEDDVGVYYWREPELMDDGDEPEDGRLKKVYLYKF